MGKVSCVTTRFKSAVLLITVAGLLSGVSILGAAGSEEEGALLGSGQGNMQAQGGCAARIPPPPSSQWGGNYSYSFTPPQIASPASVPLAIVVVNPSYKEEESALIEKAYVKVAKGFSKSMGVDMDKVLIAKGMTSIGPFSSIDEVTYVAKKDAALILVPRVFITTQITYGKWQYQNVDMRSRRMDRDFEMRISGWISFVMQEPLSAQKMWVKKLELDDIIIKDVESYQSLPIYQGNYIVGWKQGEVYYDGSVEAMANALKQYYPIIMQKFWTYLDKDEMLMLKERTKEIRDIKTY